MAQIIPPITSLPLDSIAAPAAEDIQDHLPSICVDYLSYEWSEDDVRASWRSMTRHKHEIANGVRLENASWRTWQKQRNKLKTISPETLNWLKDSDVTWLYGPLHTAHVEPVRPLKVATTDERLGIDRPVGSGSGLRNDSAAPAPTHKPILKHRTLSEMLSIPTPTSPVLEASNAENLDFTDGEGSHKERPLLLHTKSDTSISRTSSVRKRSPPRLPVSGKTAGSSSEVSRVSTPDESKGNKRHITFNTFVEQCIAVGENDLQPPESDSDDEMLEIRSNSSSRASRPMLSRNSSSTHSADHVSIAMIAPTTLKTGSWKSSNLPQMVYAPPPEYQSPQKETKPKPTVNLPSPEIRRRNNAWASEEEDEEDFSSVGYDYFRGPDLRGSNQQRQTSHVGTSYSKAPQVNAAPAQPKWRQQVSDPSSTTSSSSSSLNASSSPSQPSRGILKVRQPGSSSTTEDQYSPPTTSYFNYNPSPATGIGGMGGAYAYPGQPSVSTGSPLLSPSSDEVRGRSAQRQPGSSAYDRSASRSSQQSISPGTVRTPPLDTAARRGVTSPDVRLPPQTAPQPAAVAAGQASVANQPAKTAADKAESPSAPRNSTMDVDEPYEAQRSETPTPHSSPQIALRPLKDTSPSSLPHTSSRPSPSYLSLPFGAVPDSASSTASLPRPDPPQTVGGKATTAHVGTNAQPTLSQPIHHQTLLDDEEGDGSSIMGRAANIANTAKDLWGALWYGVNEGGGGHTGGSGTAAGGGAVGGGSGSTLTRMPSGGRDSGRAPWRGE